MDAVDLGTWQPDDLFESWTELDILAEAEAVEHLGAWAWDITSNRLWWSDETYRIFGLTPQEFPATYDGFLQYVHRDDREEVERRVRAAVEGTEEYAIVHRVICPSGEIRHAREHGRVTRDADGRPVRMVGVVRDITDEVRLQRERDAAIRALAESEERHRLLAENAWDVIWTLELDGNISYVSPSVERVRGVTPEEAVAQSLDQIHPVTSASRVREYFHTLYRAIESGGEPPTFRGELEYYRKDGSVMLGELHVMPHVDGDGRVVQLLGVTRDISERREFEERLNHLAITDPLTGVWNRRHGEELLTADLNEARRYGPPMTLLMLDIDHFKSINDTFGHQVGDRVLIEVTRRLTENLRASDVLARWGGEEFVIAMRHCTTADAVPLADKILTIISAAPFDVVGPVTVSIGISQLRPDDDLASWLERADDAMFVAKASGRNGLRVGT